jgi:hypothetical protein
MVLFNKKRFRMKITIESYGKKYSTELNYEDCTMDEYIDVFTNLLICGGFHIDTITDALKEYIDDKSNS